MKNLEKIIQRNKKMWKQAFARARPVEFDTLYLGITDDCSRNCPHCSVGPSVKGDMDPSLIENILNFSKDNHVFSVTFAGKEPLTKFDTLIAPFITNPEYKDIYFMIQTNGDLLTERVADVLDKANNCIVHLSLDGPNEKQHDLSKGKGSYKNVVRAVNLLAERNIPYGFFVTLTKDNFDHMEETTEHAVDLGAVFLHVIGYKAIGPHADSDKMLTYEQESKRYDFKKKIKEKYPYISVGRRGCNIGINMNGYSSYCPFLLEAAKGQQITNNTSHEKILTMFRENKQRYAPLLERLEECPLTENPTEFAEFVKQREYDIYEDMLKKGTKNHQKAVKISKDFWKMRNIPWLFRWQTPVQKVAAAAAIVAWLTVGSYVGYDIHVNDTAIVNPFGMVIK